jgi:hypothetical protein
VVDEDEGDHRLHHGDGAREDARVVSTPRSEDRRLARRGDGPLLLADL